MSLSDTFGSKTELIDEIMHLNKELKTRNEKIVMSKKRILLYKSVK